MRLKKTKRGYYEISIELPPSADGKRQRKRLRAKTIVDLHAKQREAEEALALGLSLTEMTSVVDLLTWWLENEVKRYRRASTYRRYEMDVRNHILPALPKAGQIPVKQLSAQHIQTLIDRAVDQGLAPRSVRNILIVLSRALTVAKRRHLVRENVASLVTMPAISRPRIRVLTPEEAWRLLEAVRETRYEVLFWMAVLLGMREGELLGLRWSSVDLDAKIVTVCEQIQRVKQPGGGSKLVWLPTKSDNGERVVALPDVLVALLQLQLARLADERTVRGWREHDLVFPSTKGTPLNAQHLIYRVFRPALEKAGLPRIPFHNLRHTAASIWIADGGDVQSVSETLGHSSAVITLNMYAHAFSDAKRAMLDRSAQRWSGDASRLLELPEKPKIRQGDTPGDTEKPRRA